MPQVTVFDMAGKSVGEMSLSAVYTYPFRGCWRRQKAMETKRHRPRKTGFHPGATVDTRRYCPGPKTKGLQLFSQQKSEEIGAEIRTFF